MNVTKETVAAAMDVSIPTEVIIAHVQKVSNYTARGRAGVCLYIQPLQAQTFLSI